MKNAVKFIYEASPFYIYLKKHYCPRCGKRLETSSISKIVNSKSNEAQNYDFSNGDTFYFGNVEFRTICFFCKSCNRFIQIQEMKINERGKKAQRKAEKKSKRKKQSEKQKDDSSS